ncbi:hypothetical protein THMIRHAM_22400 [Thiomicrorhabdus immobilis]|uniref:5-carboxymethyl-2-hydroxymuconate isomerase n=1 Tax=Thiomicrorhabdus immobilis TaxID=2791037 RepID=A0ABN6D2U9_9GAMM|nr:hypothetical protein [Thiomicrorhabdus immobilis]BCN94455.1 hypothetical protein THMIRHAM_22400 [Thiomicrorhabdus immobilis]
MPHIIIEYSIASLDAKSQETLLHDLFNAVTNTRLFEASNIKVRLHPINTFKLATNFNGFIHVQCRIHGGRSNQEQQILSESLLSVLKGYAAMKTVITVEVVEMNSASYAKGIA